MLKIAYIGFGNSVRRYHLPYVKERDFIKVKYVYRQKEEENPQREALYDGIIFTSSIEDILKDGEVNLVVINTPDEWHTHYARLALERGKNIMVEKPFAPTRREAEEIFALAEKKGLLAYVNQNRRYDGDYLILKEIVKSGILGEIVELESHYDYFNPAADKAADYLYGLGVHVLDQMVALLGIPSYIKTDVRGILMPEGGRDFFDIELYYGNTKVSVKSSQFVKLPNPRFLVHGTRGSFRKMTQGHLSRKTESEPYEASFDIEAMSNWGELFYVDKYGNDINYRVPSKITDYGRVYEDIYGCLFQGADKKIKEEEVLEVLRILETAKKEADERLCVK